MQVWYDLPSDVFHTAISNIDTFLVKMKAQPKHLSCIAVASFHLACSQYQLSGGGLAAVPDPSDLVTISQSRCSSSDLLRMEAILSSKLSSANIKLPVTPLTCLRIMWAVCRVAAGRVEAEIGLLAATAPPHLLHRLEILVCDSSTLRFRPAELALALLYTEFQVRSMVHPQCCSFDFFGPPYIPFIRLLFLKPSFYSLTFPFGPTFPLVPFAYFWFLWPAFVIL